MDVRLVNNLQVPVDVYWIENAAREVLTVPNLAAGASTPMGTYVGHAFLFTEAGKARDGILQTMVMRRDTSVYAVDDASVAASTFRPGSAAGGDDSCVDRKPYCSVSAVHSAS